MSKLVMKQGRFSTLYVSILKYIIRTHYREKMFSGCITS